MVAFSKDVIQEIRRLLGDGVARSEVAVQVGCSASTVHKVAQGKRKLNHKKAGRKVLAYQRCPECGGRVVMPCRLCKVAKKRNRKKKSVLEGTVVIGLDLRPEHHERYLEVKRNRGLNVESGCLAEIGSDGRT